MQVEKCQEERIIHWWLLLVVLSAALVLAADGDEKWCFQTGGPIGSSPAVDADGTVYFGSWDTKVYAVYTDSSKCSPDPVPCEKWRFRASSFIRASCLTAWKVFQSFVLVNV